MDWPSYTESKSMVFILALGAAFSNALISVLQRIGVEDAKEEDTLRLSLLTHALKRRVWLAGFALMIASFILQALALHFGRLSQVQPILVTEILFLVFILSTRFGYRVGAREWLGVGMASAGLAGFLVFAAPIGGNQLPENLDWVIVSDGRHVAMCRRHRQPDRVRQRSRPLPRERRLAVACRRVKQDRPFVRRVQELRQTRPLDQPPRRL